MCSSLFHQVLVYYVVLINLPLLGALQFLDETEQNPNYQVLTKNGVVQGIKEVTPNGFKYFSFMGIPYAAPPVKRLRFRSPKPVTKWKKVLDGSVEGPCCAGLNFSMSTGVTLQGQEDCLYLNVFTPKLSSLDSFKMLPVMIYIYGGAFLGGCSLRKLYGPENFIEQNVIVVTFNYRLAVFGFLSTGDLESPGNYGIKDQIAALKWVKENIRQFGGDPKKVTLFGQSAGAASANVLLVSPKAKGLFQRVIMESGSSICPFGYSGMARKVAFDIGVSMGIETNNSEELVKYLRTVDAEKLNDMQVLAVIVNILNVLTKGNVFAPTVEPYHKDAVLTEYSYDLMEKGNFHRVPIIIGINSLEMSFLSDSILMLKPFYILGDISPGMIVKTSLGDSPLEKSKIGRKIYNFYLESKRFSSSSDYAILKWLNDECFNKPIQKTASLLAKHINVYFYVFSYTGQVGFDGLKYIFGLKRKRTKEVSHGEEMFYLWRSEYMGEIAKKDALVTSKMVKLWTNFAKYGIPTSYKDPLLDNATWPKVKECSTPYLNISEKITVVYEYFNEKSFRFWENIHRKYGKKPYGWY